MKLTQDRIEELDCPADRRDRMVFDEGQKGLAVRVTSKPEGNERKPLEGKSFVAQYTFAGQKRRVPLGSCSAISLAAARKATAAILGEVAQGRDPATDRKAAKAEAARKSAEEAFTLDALLTQWAASHLAKKRASYGAEAVRALRHAFEDRLGKPAADLTDKAVARVLGGLASAGKPAMAASTLSYGRAAFGWAIGRRLVAVNPFADLSFGHVVKRDRVLDDGELRAIWHATAAPGAYNGIVRTLILTGQRREEVAGMTWGEIAPDLSAWTIAADRAKNGAEHIVPLAAPVRTMLEAARPDPAKKAVASSDLVFSGVGGVFSGWSKSKVRLDEASGVKDWRLHDLRRTTATGLQSLGVKLEVTEAVLNHISGARGGIVAVYQRHTYAVEKRAALDVWAAHVAAIVQGRAPAGNVTPMRARRA